MQALDVLLLDILHWNKAHIGPLHGFADRLGIHSVILVGLDVRLDKLRSYHPHRMPHPNESSHPVVRTTTGLESNQAGRKIRYKSAQFFSIDLLFQHDIAFFINSVKLETLFGQVDSQYFRAICKTKN